ncbi:MAG TPA: hypothetical protein VFK47_04325, partial [Ktedonobacteraceae bacterium]|nr:hypothetical protein [Ktedonobacteraceae bacterium]
MVPPLLNCVSRHNPTHAVALYLLTAPPGNGGGLPVSLSLTLSGGFNAVNAYRLALSRLAVRLHQRLLILISAFSHVLIKARIHYDMRIVKHNFGLLIPLLCNQSGIYLIFTSGRQV